MDYLRSKDSATNGYRFQCPYSAHVIFQGTGAILGLSTPQMHCALAKIHRSA